MPSNSPLTRGKKQKALVLLQHNQPAEAIPFLEQVCQTDRRDAEAWFLLAAARQELGAFVEADDAYRQVIALEPQNAEAHYYLGNTCLALGSGKEALKCFQQATSLRPSYLEAHIKLGALLEMRKNFSAAEASYRHAIRLDPSNIDLLYSLGDSLYAQEKYDEAAGRYRQVLVHQPNNVDVLTNLGNALTRAGQFDEAVAYYQQALEINPRHAKAHANLGVAWRHQGKLEEAVDCFRRAIQIQPEYADAHNNLASTLTDLGRMDEAMASCQRALTIRPDNAALNNMGYLLQNQGRIEDAIAYYQRALEVKPDDATTHVNLAHALLQNGDFERGWEEYEWRWRRKLKPRTFLQPSWDGTDLAGRTIHLYAEQGLGDTLQFIRYTVLVKQRGGTVIVECHPSLVRLIKTAAGVDQVVAAGSPLPPFDTHLPLLSLPRLLRITRKNITGTVPYLQAPDNIGEGIKTALESAGDRIRVGIAWSGNPVFRQNYRRLCPLSFFKMFGERLDVALFSLQKGGGGYRRSDQGSRFPHSEPVISAR